MYLCTMYVIKRRNGFEFHYNIVIAYKVGSVCLMQLYTIIHNIQFLLTFKRNASTLQFYLKCFLIDRFKESYTQLIVYMHGRSHHIVRLFLVIYHGFVINTKFFGMIFEPLILRILIYAHSYNSLDSWFKYILRGEVTTNITNLTNIYLCIFV
jgi:hypothetical protein